MLPHRLKGWPTAVLFLWLVAASVLIYTMRAAIPTGQLSDTDDYMRLLQVRDWLAGQSWYDLHQYRLNAPHGAVIHWTRLVDLPLAAGFVALTPMLGAAWAENVTMTLVPLLLLLGGMLTVGWTVSRLVQLPGGAEFGPVMLLLNLFTLPQFMPLRIDHHGWQLGMAALTVAGLVAGRGIGAAIVAGAALGFWLTVSIEGLPFTAVCMMALGIWWAFDPAQGRRLSAFAAALALSAGAFFLVTIAPAQWAWTYCDSTSAAHVVALALAAAGIATLTFGGIGSNAFQRLLGLLFVAGAAGGALALVAPQCLGSPFSRMDPLVYKVWYLNVSEGLPVWRLAPDMAVQILFMPVISMAGCIWQVSRAEDGDRKWRWIVLSILLAGSIAVSMLVMRASGVAAIVAIPGALVVVSALIRRARAIRTLSLRAIGTTVAILLPTPLTPAIATSYLVPAKHDPADRLGAMDRAGIDAIGALPPTVIFAPLDASPMLIARTGHHAIAAGYHRNDRVMADVIRVYTGSPEQAHAIVARYRARYLLSTRIPEEDYYRRIAPKGLSARLAAGRPPEWLHPVPMPPGKLKLWRVVR